MIRLKTVEIRDAGTFIPALAICVSVEQGEPSAELICPKCERVIPVREDDYLLSRAGWGSLPGIALLRLTPVGGARASAQWSAYDWEMPPRTMLVAHAALSGEVCDGVLPDRAAQVAFDRIQPGDVIDVEWLLGLTATPKKSERYL
jgi:hypothetical protein